MIGSLTERKIGTSVQACSHTHDLNRAGIMLNEVGEPDE